jgi:outer membrane murein-binding lipoprotein Lpp
METIKKKMATLRQTLEEAEGRATSAEDELKRANDRADQVL